MSIDKWEPPKPQHNRLDAPCKEAIQMTEEFCGKKAARTTAFVTTLHFKKAQHSPISGTPKPSSVKWTSLAATL